MYLSIVLFIDELKVEKMIVCQQYLRSCTLEELGKLIEEAIPAYIESHGGRTKRSLDRSLFDAEKRRREDE